MPRISKARETESRLVAAKSWGSEGVGVTAKGYKVPFSGEEKVLEVDRGVDCMLVLIVKALTLIDYQRLLMIKGPRVLGTAVC